MYLKSYEQQNVENYQKIIQIEQKSPEKINGEGSS